MKIRKSYVLYINNATKMCFYGGDAFNNRISKITLGEIYDCSLHQLKNNIRILENNNFSILKMKW